MSAVGAAAATGESGLLTTYFLAVLSPLLAVGPLAEPGLARQAAAEALAAWQAHGQAELMLAGQITGLALAALDDLRLSAQAEVSVPLALKLRGNALALNRAGQAMTTELRRLQREDGPPPGMDPAAEAQARQAALAALHAARDAVRQAGAVDAQAGGTPPGAGSHGGRDAVAGGASAPLPGHGPAAVTPQPPKRESPPPAPADRPALAPAPPVPAPPVPGPPVPGPPVPGPPMPSPPMPSPPVPVPLVPVPLVPVPPVPVQPAVASPGPDPRGAAPGRSAAAARPAPEPLTPPTPPPSHRRRALVWAGAMTDVAAELAAGLDRLPPRQRRADVARIGLLSEAAWRLSQGGAPGREALLGSTWLAAPESPHRSAPAVRTVAAPAGPARPAPGSPGSSGLHALARDDASGD